MLPFFFHPIGHDSLAVVVVTLLLGLLLASCLAVCCNSHATRRRPAPVSTEPDTKHAPSLDRPAPEPRPVRHHTAPATAREPMAMAGLRHAGLPVPPRSATTDFAVHATTPVRALEFPPMNRAVRAETAAAATPAPERPHGAPPRASTISSSSSESSTLTRTATMFSRATTISSATTASTQAEAAAPAPAPMPTPIPIPIPIPIPTQVPGPSPSLPDSLSLSSNGSIRSAGSAPPAGLFPWQLAFSRSPPSISSEMPSSEDNDSTRTQWGSSNSSSSSSSSSSLSSSGGYRDRRSGGGGGFGGGGSEMLVGVGRQFDW
ncbi:hypothetical protein VTJ83DRAFT_5943 [Remersonia thermophila]|uniref:Uncharacterized protein n=1 Tax=Remersonia thermophila TaxID=72144 RepID=A0ABR4D8C9_9PEZI